MRVSLGSANWILMTYANSHLTGWSKPTDALAGRSPSGPEADALQGPKARTATSPVDVDIPMRLMKANGEKETVRFLSDHVVDVGC
jgi:hypothetical protein